MAKKKRLDQLLTEQGLAVDLKKAQAIIGAGQVIVNTRTDYKAGSLVPADSEIRLRKKKSAFVSRGGEKLAGGLKQLGIEPAGWICADIGSSTGGFTDCLLQRKAVRVYAVDVGYGLLAWKLRQDERVILHERTNARYLTRQHVPDPVDLAVLDASFISLQPLLPPLLPLFGPRVRIVALVKPQFELAQNKVGQGGIVRDRALHQEALESVKQFAGEIGLHCQGEVASSVCGAKGNQEFLLYFTAL
ncbi:TlyA family RNA methyltransferase [Candidatus Electrothrix sp.]|uniref:TlyA family RNA methyltransferase n=1 Tax=Candidatus Electrothrix sp. TaxID=2170559 RepID=UPI004055B1E4